MDYQIILILWLQVSIIYTAPLQLRLIQPNMVQPMENMLQQQGSLQQQILALQQFQQLQAMQRMNALQNTVAMNPQRPLLILLPDVPQETVDQLDRNDENKHEFKHSTGLEDEASDSVVVDAEDVQMKPKNGLLVLPSGRFSIGGLISLIPFLPFEVNVPDSISWIYNGISGIISGIGQRLPFRPQNSNAEMSQQSLLRLGMDDTRRKQGILPILVMPFGGTVLPVQVN